MIGTIPNYSTNTTQTERTKPCDTHKDRKQRTRREIAALNEQSLSDTSFRLSIAVWGRHDIIQCLQLFLTECLPMDFLVVKHVRLLVLTTTLLHDLSNAQRSTLLKRMFRYGCQCDWDVCGCVIWVGKDCVAKEEHQSSLVVVEMIPCED